MANGKNTIVDEESSPPGLDFLCSSFLDPQTIVPVRDSDNLLEIKQQNLVVRIETDLETCHQLFEQFSPKKTLFELWGFRYAFYLGYKDIPIFMIFERNGEPLGLLPLWYEKDKDELRWFGSWWQEGNTFWIKDKSIIPIVLTLFPQKVLLNAIQMAPRTAQKLGLIADDPKYLLSLEDCPTIESFLQRFNGKKRYNLRRDQKIILSKNPKTCYNRFEDIETLFDLSIKRFAKRDGSPFETENRKQTFRDIMNQSGEYEIRIISTEIDNEIVGVDLVAIYKDIYYTLQGAYNLDKHPGLGNYTNFLLIEDAINLGAKSVDFLEVSYGWKEDWFQPIPLFQFKGIKEQNNPNREKDQATSYT